MEGEDMTEQDHNTTLGTQGVPYRSEAAEELIAERMRQLSASGRPADRIGVIRELATKGEIQTMVPGAQTEAAWNQELLDSLPSERRAQLGEASQGAGRTLAEGMAVAAAQRTAERHSEASSEASSRPSGDRLVELSEESDYERRVRAWTSQGYPRHDAVWRIELQDRMRASG
jgi:hypothetical protein